MKLLCLVGKIRKLATVCPLAGLLASLSAIYMIKCLYNLSILYTYVHVVILKGLIILLCGRQVLKYFHD